MSLFKDFFGSNQPKSLKGKPNFQEFTTHTQANFKRAVNKGLKSYNDRKAALTLDKEVRGSRKSEVSNLQYLKAAKKKYGYNSGFVSRLKERALTDYKPTEGLSEVRRRMNIYDAQQDRAKDEAGKTSGVRFASQSDPSKSSPTASRLGASPGQTAVKPSSGDVERPILVRPMTGPK